MDRLLIHEDARSEYIESYVWYHERGSHIADAFEREVEHALQKVCEFPDCWALYTGS